MTKILANNFEFRLDERDIVNPEDMIPAGESNPHNVRLWLLHDHGFTVCAVFATSLQDALDDSDKIEELRQEFVETEYTGDSTRFIYDLDTDRLLEILVG